MAADGRSNRDIADAGGIDQHQVLMWRRRYEAEGLDGLEDRARPRRPLVYGHDDRLKVGQLFLSIVARRLLRHGDFVSIDDLATRTLDFTDDYSHTAKPFRRTYAGRALQVA
jgi:hypothetical protein